MIDLQIVNTHDPLKRMAEKESGGVEFSPMDPPEAYAPPVLDSVPYADLHPCLQALVDEHNRARTAVDEFEKALVRFKRSAWQNAREAQSEFSSFFRFTDEVMIRHHLKEERVLFPALNARLAEREEHSKGKFPRTAVDLLEDDHVKIMQHLTLMFNFLGLAPRLPDSASRALTYDVAAEQGFALIELLKLHLFREENVAFPKANKYIGEAEFNVMQNQMLTYAHY